MREEEERKEEGAEKEKRDEDGGERYSREINEEKIN